MYINTDSFKEKHICGDCRNDTICRFCADMKYKIDEVKSIQGEALSPVTIEVNCRKFERKNTKQDGVCYTAR